MLKGSLMSDFARFLRRVHPNLEMLLLACALLRGGDPLVHCCIGLAPSWRDAYLLFLLSWSRCSFQPLTSSRDTRLRAIRRSQKLSARDSSKHFQSSSPNRLRQRNVAGKDGEFSGSLFVFRWSDKTDLQNVQCTWLILVGRWNWFPDLLLERY